MNETPAAAAVSRPGLIQAVTGVVPPQTAEARLRTIWPAVTAVSAAGAGLGATLIRTKLLAPLGWFLLAPLYFKKILPFLARRYALTNRRVVILSGLRGKPSGEVALADIDEVRLVESSYSTFYRAATLELVSAGQVKLSLPGVPEPEAIRQSILNAVMAWVPGKSKALPMIPASAVK